jgi:hypothetical protein
MPPRAALDEPDHDHWIARPTRGRRSQYSQPAAAIPAATTVQLGSGTLTPVYWFVVTTSQTTFWKTDDACDSRRPVAWRLPLLRRSRLAEPARSDPARGAR